MAEQTLIPWIEKATLFKCLHGSHAYGLNTPESDIDIRGICIPPEEYYMGLKRFKQTEKKETEDIVIFEISRFAELAIKGNPNIFEILFVDESDILYMNPLIKPLFDIKEAFLSKRVRQTFFGYAKNELKKIESHRGWLLKPPKEEPTRESFNLPERSLIPKEHYDLINSQIRKIIDSFELNLQDLDDSERIQVNTEIKNQLRNAGLSAENIMETIASLGIMGSSMIEIFIKEREYRKAKNHWSQYQNWLKSRNPKRAAIEAKCGYDGKNASHLLRLLTMGNEMLEKAKVIIKRPDKDFLMAAKMGILTFEEVMKEVEHQMSIIDENYNKSSLPKKPDIALIEKTIVSIIKTYLNL